MRSIHFVLIWVALLFLSTAFAEGNPLQQGRAQYDQQNFEEALDSLQRAYAEQQTPETARYLGLTYYQVLRYEEARPLLERAAAASPGDAPVLSALIHVALQANDVAAARGYLLKLQRAAPNAAETYGLEGRVELADGREAEAIAAFRRATDQDPTSFASEELLRLYTRRGDSAKARQVAETALAAARPDSFEAERFKATLKNQGKIAKPVSAFLGYRYEIDSNVALEPNTSVIIPGLTDKSDQRHVLTGDLLGQYRITGGWDAFGEVHLSGSWHQQLSQYDSLRQNYLLGLGWSGPTFGLRLPYEYTHITLDGNPYLSEHSLAPGVVFRFDTATLYGFYRYKNLNYTEDVAPSEGRGGHANSLGALLLAPFHQGRGLLRMTLEGGTVDTDGRNWDRDEASLFADLNYGLTSWLSGGIGFEWAKQQYSNVHDTYFVKRDDKATTLFASLSYLIDKSWEVRLQGSWVNGDSNIPVYQYDRAVGSLGVTWKY